MKIIFDKTEVQTTPMRLRRITRMNATAYIEHREMMQQAGNSCLKRGKPGGHFELLTLGVSHKI
jgi:predicted house-cleaning NTP pyrophosphatase (Maf/HAM1 superfamily)